MKLKLSLLLIIAISIFGCNEVLTEMDTETVLISQKDSILTTMTPEALADSLANISTGSGEIEKLLKSASVYGEYTDWSGDVTVKIFNGSTYPQMNHNDDWVMYVDDDYVCIGGGVNVMGDNPSSGGGLIVDSRPLADFSGWLASSKDHLIADPHYLEIYAIGLKLNGVSKSDLLSRLRLYRASSSEQHHPSISASVSSSYDLIGGGADITYDGAGCLLTESYPNGNRWYVKGKDHGRSDPSKIEAWAIGIEKGIIPGFGELEFSVTTHNDYVSTYLCQAHAPFSSGWVIACPGGRSQYNDEGRLLQWITPSSYNTVISKDHRYKDGGTTYAYNLLIRKKP